VADEQHGGQALEDRRAAGHRHELGGLARAAERGLLAELADVLGGIVAGMSGVHTGPGATLFTRIPRGPSIWARPAHMFAIPAFVAA